GGIIVQKDKKLRIHNKLLFIPGFFLIYSLFIPVVLADILIYFYQICYFGAFYIPKINRKEYVIFDRGKLDKLDWYEKFNCTYCSYVNGVVNYARAVAIQTEIYSCAIKHK